MTLGKPLIVPEGKTDAIYLRSAIIKLKDYYPQLGKPIGDKFSSNVRFMKYSSTTSKILQLSGGTGGIKCLINGYKKDVESFGFKPLAYPVIVLIDNDDGAKGIFSVIKNKYKINISHKTVCPFYHLYANLYLVKTPEMDIDCKSYIEQLFDQEWLEKTIDGKEFDPSNNIDTATKYSKAIFAKKVIIPNVNKINFSGFRKLLDRIVAVLDDYKNRKPQPA